MSITFRIATPADDETGQVARINARHLAAFRAYASGGSLYIAPHLGKRIPPSGCALPTRNGSPGAANRTLEMLSALFSTAIEMGQASVRYQPGTRGSPQPSAGDGTSPSDAEMSRLGTVLDERSAASPLHVAALRLLLLTGCRFNEIVGLQWHEVRGQRLLLSDSKTGPRTAWLGEEARAVLDGLPRPRGMSAIFRDERRGAPIHLDWFWRTTCERAGLGKVRLHDLRHSFASHAAARSETLPMIGKLLGHAKIASTARYAHLDDSVLADAAEQIGALIATAIGDLPLYDRSAGEPR